MAGINSAIRITDGMSPALKSMNKALNIVLNSFEKVQAISGNAIDVADIRDARAELANAATAVNRLENEFEQVEAAQKKVTKEVHRTESAMSGLLKKAAGLAATYVSFQSAAGLVNLSDKMSQTTSRLSLIVDVDENASREEIAKATKELEEKIFASANRSRGAYLDTAASVAAFAQRASDSFSGNDEVIAFAETLNKMYVIAGATATEQSSSMLQLTQALGSGVLRGEEFNAVFEAAPNIMQAVAKYMDIPIGQLRSMAEEGKITADVVKNAIFAATEEVNEDFNNMKWTWQQVFTSFKNFAIKALDPVLSKISELANNEDVQRFAINAGKAVSVLGAALMWVFELVVGIANFIADNWGFIEPLMWGIAAAVGAYTTALLINAAIQGATAIATIAKAAATWFQTGATWAATAAQYGLNTAMYACPIVWIIMLVIALIAILIALWDNLDGFRRFVGDTYEFIGKGMGRLYNSVIVPIVNAVFSVNRKLVDGTTSFAKDMINKFADLAIGVVENFDFITDAVRNMLEMYNSIAGFFGHETLNIDFVTSSKGIDKMRNDMLKKLDVYSDAAIQEFQPVDELNLDEWDAKMKAGGDAVADFKVMDFAKGLFNDVFGLGEELAYNPEDFATDFASSIPSYEDLLSGMGEDVGSIKDGMEISEEELKYLTDIAEREAINRFTTAEIKIDMQNNNSIASGMDIDGIVMQLEDKLYESMEIAAEGAY